MPVEIRELQITAAVQDTSVQKPSASATVNNESIIQACVEAVLEILKQKNER